MQASLMRCFLFLRFFAAPVFAGFDGGIPKGCVFGPENTWERSDLTM